MGAAIVIAFGASLILAAGASAAGIVVNSTADPGGTGECTLRQAIESANTDTIPVDSNCVQGSGADTITFDPAILPATIQLVTSGDPNELGIGSDLTIQGPGVNQLTVTAATTGGRSRVFNVTSGTVTISGLTATGGHLNLPGPGFPSFQGGAGILVSGGSPTSLTLDHVAVVGNSTSMSFNGGSNQAATFGGGIFSSGDLTVTDTTVSGNSATAQMTGANDSFIATTAIADGAGIYLEGSGNLSIARSAITGNTGTATAIPASSGPGVTTNTEAQGAIFAGSGLNSASVTGSTIANNPMTAGAATNVFNRGGGIHSETATTVTSDTITGNSASDGANLEGTAITLKNTILADPQGGGSNCEFFGGTASAGYNWADDTSCDPTGIGDVSSGDPNLETLGSYGGPTQTRPPKAPTGPTDTGVIDQGVAASQSLDQRGFRRTWDFGVTQPTGGDGTDIGAVEAQGPTFTGSTPASPGDSANPSLFGTSEKSSTVEFFNGAVCGGTPIGPTPLTDTQFANPGKTVGPLAVNSLTAFSAQTTYGTVTSVCSDPFTYQRRPALPTLDSTNPPSGGNNNNPSLIGTSSAPTTVNIYTQAGCTGPVAGTGSDLQLEGAGIPVSVPDNSTTTFYAKATGIGGTTDCSTGLAYTEVTPAPPAPPSNSSPPPATSGPTGQRAAALKKCKKKRGSARKKCKKKANLLPV